MEKYIVKLPKRVNANGSVSKPKNSSIYQQSLKRKYELITNSTGSLNNNAYLAKEKQVGDQSNRVVEAIENTISCTDCSKNATIIRNLQAELAGSAKKQKDLQENIQALTGVIAEHKKKFSALNVKMEKLKKKKFSEVKEVQIYK